MRLHSSTLLAVSTTAILLALLTGCVPTVVEEPTATPTPSRTTASPTPTPTASAEPTVPVTISCDELVTAQQLYDYNPNFAPDASYSPAPGSLAAEAVELDGIACGWVNLTSGQTIVMSAAHLSDAAITERGNELFGSSNSVPTYGVEGYFLFENGIGTAEAFSPPFWITASSVIFLEPGDVTPLMTAAISALG